MVMLDTNICIYILKEHPDHIKNRFDQVGEVHLSAVVYAELCYGIENGSKQLQSARWKELNAFLAPITIHAWDQNAAQKYGVLCANLKSKGMLIGQMDMLIAAHALSLDATLVTNNTHEFERVLDLKLENWYQAS